MSRNFHLAQTHRVPARIVRLPGVTFTLALCRVDYDVCLRECCLAHAWRWKITQNASAYADKFNFLGVVSGSGAEHVQQGHRMPNVRLADDAGRRNAVHSSSNGMDQCMTFRFLRCSAAPADDALRLSPCSYGLWVSNVTNRFSRGAFFAFSSHIGHDGCALPPVSERAR